MLYNVTFLYNLTARIKYGTKYLRGYQIGNINSLVHKINQCARCSDISHDSGLPIDIMSTAVVTVS